MGRTPFVPGSIGGSPGRDHNKYGLLCGWQVAMKAGHIGGTDFSLRAVEEPIHIRNVHATLLDLMGLTMNSYAICMLVVIVASQTSVVKSYMI